MNEKDQNRDLFKLTKRESLMLGYILNGYVRNSELVDLLNDKQNYETRSTIASALNHLSDKTRSYFCPDYTGRLKKLRLIKLLSIYNVIEDIHSKPDPNFPLYIDPIKLTPAQREIVYLYSEGLEMNDIASILNIETKTINDQLYKTMDRVVFTNDSPRNNTLHDRDSYVLLALGYMRSTYLPESPYIAAMPPLFLLPAEDQKSFYYEHLREQVVLVD